MSVWGIATASFGAPPRGPGSQPNLDLNVQSMAVTWSWGSQPAQGEVTYVAEDGEYPLVVAGSYCELNVFGKQFYGICGGGPNVVGGVVQPSRAASGGKELRVRFMDTRVFLQYDYVFGAFNMLETRIVNGVRVRWYWHLLPSNFQRHYKSWTNTPYTAAQILDFIFGAPSLETAWLRVYHPDQLSLPVYGVDCLNGRRVDDVVQEITDAHGLLFTLMGGPTRLVWQRKGLGAIPSFPSNSDDQEIGFTLAGNPTRVNVVGDRNRYLLLNLPMTPDWNRNWEQLFHVDLLAADLFHNEIDSVTGEDYNAIAGDAENVRGWTLAAARAREITVREYSALRVARDGVSFADPRKFSGQNRMDIPAAIYIDALVFRAFRPPAVVVINGEAVPVEALEIADDMIAKVTHDLTAGTMSIDGVEAFGGNGYVIAQGYRVGADLFQSINPARFNLEDFNNAADLWQVIPFHLDDSGADGRFIVLDEPLVRSQDLIEVVDGYAVLNAAPTFDTPMVRAALTFEGDRFFYAQGSPGRDHVANVSGLYGEYVVDAGIILSEVPYKDGLSVGQKAAELATVLLNQPYLFVEGRHRRQLQVDEIPPDLDGMLNRVTVQFSDRGHSMEVELAAEPGRQTYMPEREFDRIARQSSLLPGQQELRDQARAFRLLSAALKQSPGFTRKTTEVLRGRFGRSMPPAEPVITASPAGTLPVGAPLWKAPTAFAGSVASNTQAVMPANVGTEHAEFAGVTVRQSEDPSKPLGVQKSEEALVRVLGPVAFGDSVGRALASDYLVKSGEPAVGVVQEEILTGVVKLARVLVGTGAGGGTAVDVVWG